MSLRKTLFCLCVYLISILFIYIYIFLFLFFLSSYCFLISNCPSSIQHWDSNSQPSDYESPPLTTRPGRLPIVSIFKNHFYIYLFLSNTLLHICANPYVSLCICLWVFILIRVHSFNLLLFCLSSSSPLYVKIFLNLICSCKNCTRA